jgi:short-subunit dehydrogenase
LKRKLVVVTGGTKGIGKAIAFRFADAGFDIVTCARNGKELSQLQQELETTHDARCMVYESDLSVRRQIDAFAEFVKSLSRPVDVLVNNAGTFVPGQILDEPDGNLDIMIQSNLYSAYHFSRAIVPGMKENARGHVFNICSIASIKAYPNGGSYAISKFALLGFSKCLREELKESGVRVTAVLPGATYTDSWAVSPFPEERFMPASDVAEMIYAAYSLSDRSVVEELLIRPQLGDL